MTLLTAVSAKFIVPSDRQDKYVIGPICLISSRTEMSDVASNTMYIYSESDRYQFGPNPMKWFSYQDRMSYIYIWSFTKFCGHFLQWRQPWATGCVDVTIIACYFPCRYDSNMAVFVHCICPTVLFTSVRPSIPLSECHAGTTTWRVTLEQ